MEEGDLETLKNGTVDFYTFSYYMTNCVSNNPDVETTRSEATYFAGGVNQSKQSST